jgi:hypothetical protein
MSCASFGSTSEVALFYAVDPDPLKDMPAATAWKPVPYTGESLDASLSSTVSGQITSTRSYANSQLTQGEVGGSISYEVFYGSFFENMLIAALQAPTVALHLTEDTRSWDDADTIQNGKTKKCFAFMKRVTVADGKVDMYLFRGVQISSMSISVEPGSLISGELTIAGTGLGNPEAGKAVYKGVSLTTLPTEMASYTFEAYPDSTLMGSSDGLKALTILDGKGADTKIVAQSFSLTIDNQLRQQFAVGQGTFFASGVGSGRIMVTMSLSAYYSSPVVFESFVADDDLTVTFGLKDVDGKGYEFETFKVKVTSGSTPQAGGPDADLLISTELQAFEDGTDGTIQITLDAGTP